MILLMMKLSVKLFSFFNGAVIRRFCICKWSELMLDLAGNNSHVVSADSRIKKNVFVSCLVVASDAFIKTILRFCSLSQIAKPVVVAVAVDMVNFMSRPVARHIKPGHSVRPVINSADGKYSVSAVFDCAANVASAGARPPFIPSKDSAFRAISDQLFNVVVAESGFFYGGRFGHFDRSYQEVYRGFELWRSLIGRCSAAKPSHNSMILS